MGRSFDDVSYVFFHVGMSYIYIYIRLLYIYIHIPILHMYVHIYLYIYRAYIGATSRH